MKCPERLIKETFRDGLSVNNFIHSINRAILCPRIDVISHTSIEILNGLNGLVSIYLNAQSIERGDELAHANSSQFVFTGRYLVTDPNSVLLCSHCYRLETVSHLTHGVLMVVSIKIVFFCSLTTCRMVCRYQYFGRFCYLHLRGRTDLSSKLCSHPRRLQS